MFKMYTKLLEISVLICLSAITSHSQSLNTEQEIQLSEQYLASNSSNEVDGRQSDSNCGLSRSSSFIREKIVNGQPAKERQFPWQCFLKIFDSQNRPVQCGGSIINSRWVLTAAHCVSDEKSGQSFVRSLEITAGIRNRMAQGTGSQRRYADCVIQHPNWRGSNGQFLNDIALVRIASDNPFDLNLRAGGSVGTICLPPKATPFFEYTGKARISGWGLTKDRGTPSDVLMYTDVNILDNKKCKTYQYPVPIANSMICQGPEKTSPCQGDSGGPLIVALNQKQPTKFTQIGVVSFGPGQCANGKIPSAIYTKVSHHREWIDKTIADNNRAQCGRRALIPPETDQQQQQQIEEEDK